MNREKIKQTIEFLQEKNQQEEAVSKILKNDSITTLTADYWEFIISTLDLPQSHRDTIFEFIISGSVCWNNEDGTIFETADIESFIDALLN